MIQIIPAILATNEGQYRQEITRLNDSPSLEGSWVHIDFADNIFVQNETIVPETINKFPTNLHKEAHLMVANPKNWVEKLAKAKFERIIIHVETNDVNECIEIIKSNNLQVGLAINNETPIEKLEPFIDKIDVVLVMTIVPGFQGQPFIAKALDKVREIKVRWSAKIGVDGHVNIDNVRQVIGSGVDFMVVGSYLLKGHVEENLENMWEVING